MKICKTKFFWLLTALCLLCSFVSPALAETTGILQMPGDLQVIEEEAFCGDTGLTTVVLDVNVSSIGPRAFANSTLQTISIPNSVTYIAADAFENCALVEFICGTDSYAYQYAQNHSNITVREGKTTIEAWSLTDELFDMIDLYMEQHPDLAERYTVNKNLINNDGNAYINAIDSALMNGAVDIYCAEADHVYKYAKGAAAPFAATYKELGIKDLDAKIAEAQIAPYSVQIGSRNGQVVALSYQSTSGAFIYRRSIARAVWGTDDPGVVGEKIGAGSGSWEAFFAAAEDLKAKGYKIVSGLGDVWNVIRAAAPTGWVVNGKLNIDPVRESWLDMAKTLIENQYTNGTGFWGEAWYADMEGGSNVLGYYGPSWLLNYVIATNCGNGGSSSFGDWAVCLPNVGFYWGGTWVFGSRDAAADPAKAEFIRGFLEWVTLDTSKTGLQYQYANEFIWLFDRYVHEPVCSGKVMAMSDGTFDFLGGQNMFEIFVQANDYASGSNLTGYDSVCNDAWRNAVYQYACGECDRDTAIMNFKMDVEAKTGIEVEY